MNRNTELFARAKARIPGGVNSPVRSFARVGGTPRFIARAKGPHLYDVEGNRYIDHVLSWGPLILGHAHPAVVEALKIQAEAGTSYGAPTELEVQMAELICQAMPSMERVRFVNSGTEATMSALRLARAGTGREIIVKFEGCYHGHVDALLVKAGSGALTLGKPDSAGIPQSLAATTAVLPYNDTRIFREFMAQRGDAVAAVIVEPIGGNMGVILPQKGFLEVLRHETRERGALLIFDEVITGFRLCLGGYQDLCGIRPDLTCLGKIIGGGLPVGAFGGRQEIMRLLAPEGPVYQAGTLSGNPLAMAAGLATLKVLRDESPYAGLARTMETLTDGLEDAAARQGIPLAINRVGSMAGLFFQDGAVRDFEGVMSADAQRYTRFFHALLEKGVYVAPSPFEAFFVSTAHSPEVIGQTLEACREALATL